MSSHATESTVRLDEQSVLVTGGCGSIGRHLTRDLRESGAEVIVVDRRISDETAGVRYVEADLGVEKEARAVVAKIVEEHEISVLVNAAGLIHSEPLVNLLDRVDPTHGTQTWERVLASNLDTTFHASVHVVNHMVRSRIRGVVVNFSSISAVGNRGQSAYSAAKAAVEALTVTWARELGAFGIRCVGISPGFIDTPSTHAALSQEAVAEWVRKIPLRRLGTPDEVAGAVRFVIENDYFNGRVLRLDGGLSL